MLSLKPTIMKKRWITIQLIAGAFLCTTLFAGSAFAQNTPKLTDPEIASAAVTANQIDVDYAIIALERSDNSAVRKFARKMIDDHTSVIQQATALVQKLGVTPKSNKLTKSLLKGKKETSKKLKSKWGIGFGMAYINNEVQYHKDVISALKNVLIPQTKSKQLKGLLKKVMPVLNHHLKMAESAQKKIASSG
jgi:putative membrane protein